MTYPRRRIFDLEKSQELGTVKLLCSVGFECQATSALYYSVSMHQVNPRFLTWRKGRNFVTGSRPTTRSFSSLQGYIGFTDQRKHKRNFDLFGMRVDTPRPPVFFF
jgi:hypothetical protein